MKKTLIALLFLVLPAPVLAQELPDSIIRAVAMVSSYSAAPFESENLVAQGSGVFVDHAGCLMTNSHVVLTQLGDPAEHFVARIAADRARKPEQMLQMDLIFVDAEIDLAYLCPQDARDFFHYAIPKVSKPAFATRPYGQNIWLLGYPAAGLETISVTPGHIVGFVENPDISDWVGFPQQPNGERLSLYKVDSLAGPGISGGLLMSADRQILGLPFAGNLQAGGFIFVLSEKVYLEFDRELRQYLHAENLVPADCVFDLDSQYYYQSGQKFYDQQCSLAFDQELESQMDDIYVRLCAKEMLPEQKVMAIRRVKELGVILPWQEFVLQHCAGKGGIAPVEVPLASFAYGKARLTDLNQEQKLAHELKQEIDARYPNLKIHEKDWSTLVNAYVYGEYPLPAINKAIELGGKTVHPGIPWPDWRGSNDYQSNM